MLPLWLVGSDPSPYCIQNNYIDTMIPLLRMSFLKSFFWLAAFLPLVKLVIDLYFKLIDLARMNISVRRWVIFNFSTPKGKVTSLWALWTMSQRCFSCCWCSVNPWPMCRCLPFKARNIDERLQRPGRWDRSHSDYWKCLSQKFGVKGIHDSIHEMAE